MVVCEKGSGISFGCLSNSFVCGVKLCQLTNNVKRCV